MLCLKYPIEIEYKKLKALHNFSLTLRGKYRLRVFWNSGDKNI
jgi:hypothetical protein